MRSAQVLAATRGRGHVLPDDVKELAEPVLAHRVITQPEARLRRLEAGAIITDLLHQVPIPMSPVYA